MGAPHRTGTLTWMAVASIAVGCSGSESVLPRIASFTATPAAVTPGGTALLTWEVTAADSLSLSPGPGAVSGNSLYVSPTVTTVYTLTASSGGGVATASVTVAVVPRPAVASFAATPPAIAPGGTSQLTWAVTGADAVSIDPGVGVVTGSSVSVSPSVSTTYTLTATNAASSVTAQATVTVQLGGPRIKSFSATPPTIAVGGSSLLSWEVVGADSLSIDPAIGVVTGANLTVTPASTTTYTLTARGAGSTSTATVTVTVLSPPVIASFTATPASIAPGGSSWLSWSVSGAATVSIDQGVGTVTGTSVQVTPPATTTYTLHATNAAGGSAVAQVTVSVQGNELPHILSFVATPDQVSPGLAVVLSWSVTGADTLVIDHGVGAVTGTSLSVTPSATITYTLQATNPAGSASATVTVTVQGSPSATYPVGQGPFGIVFDGSSMWIANAGGGTVTRLRASDGMAQGTFPVGLNPRGRIAFDGSSLWVTNTDGGSVTRLSATDGSTLQTIALPGQPHGAVFDGTHVWVPLYGMASVARLRASDGVPAGTFAVGVSPKAAAFDGNDVWITSETEITRLRASDGTRVAAYAPGDDPFDIALGGGSVWITQHGGNTVSRLRISDGSSLGEVTVGSNPLGVAFDGTSVWVANTGSGTVTRLRASDGARTGDFTVGPHLGDYAGPYGVACGGSRAWVTSYAGNSVVVF